jgi:thioredoxin 1
LSVGSTVVTRDFLRSQQAGLDSLLEENRQLSEDLFQPRLTSLVAPEDLIRPYDESADARAGVFAGRKSAEENDRFLMITFGANWCQDCRNLYVNLESEEVSAYVDDKFDFVRVDIGKFNRNVELARELGVNLEYGVPAAIFYDRDGNVIGATNEGELEPARLYTSKQILKFVRDVTERSRILAPNVAR